MSSPLLIPGKSGAFSGNYYAEWRTPNQLAFLYQKICTAAASCCGSGVGTIAGSGLGNDGMYSSAPATKGVSNGARFVPKAHITAVKTTNEGDMGTIERCEVAFTVYSLGQLNAASGFFIVGGTLNCSFGWSKGFGSHNFTGKVINYSYSLNGDGGFDCTCTAIGEGLAIPNINPNAGIISAGEFTDETGKVFQGGSVYSNMYVLSAKLAAPGTSNYDGKYGGFALEEAWTTLPVDPKTPIPAGQKKNYFYCSLGAIVEELNKILKTAGLTSQIIIQSWVRAPKFEPDGATASPLTILTGPAAYGTNSFTGIPLAGTDPGNVAIGLEFLKKVVGGIGKDNKPSGKSRNISISNFLDQIFQEISDATGGACALTLIGAPNGKDVWIVDSVIMDTVGKGMITAVTQGGEARSMTIVSKLPSEVSAMSYVATNSDAVQGKNADWKTFGCNGGGGGAATDNWAAARQALVDTGVFPETVEAAKGQLSIHVKSGFGKAAVPIPIDFGATVDGQSGWRWGMAVTSNYLPGIYQQGNVYFVVTNVEHNVQGGDWTTTLTTIMRLVG